jgi:hypothetical protein
MDGAQLPAPEATHRIASAAHDHFADFCGLREDALVASLVRYSLRAGGSSIPTK